MSSSRAFPLETLEMPWEPEWGVETLRITGASYIKAVLLKKSGSPAQVVQLEANPGKVDNLQNFCWNWFPKKVNLC